MVQPLLVGGRPWWEAEFPQEAWPAFEDFRNFLILVWDHLGLPAPSPAQLEVAHRLQYGTDSVEWEWLTEPERAALLEKPREDIIRAFRSLGKSYVVSAFVLWRLMRNPRDEKVLVISATSGKAAEFVDQTKGIMSSMPLTKWLVNGPREKGQPRRDKVVSFDVARASLSQSPSLIAKGITGQITGSRATLIVGDDIEVPENSKTEDGRANILRKVRSDLGPIGWTEHGRSDTIFLGTPQTLESIYNVLVKEMGYRCFCIPIRFPEPDRLENYVLTRDETQEEINILAPYLRAAHDEGHLSHGDITDTRFGWEDVIKEEGKGRLEFTLQYMLDTSLSDAERFPLKQHDLVVMATNHRKAPLTVQWGRHSDQKNLVAGVPNLGFSGDHLLRPLFVDEEWRDYEGTVLWVDPSGRGKDETSWAVIGQLAGTLYLIKLGAYAGDPAEAMRRIAVDAKAYNVNVVEIEPNYAQGVWIEAFKPILLNVWNDGNHEFLSPEDGRAHAVEAKKAGAKMSGCTVQESEWAKGQKETRIIGTLEPVMTSHRLVVNEEIVHAEARPEDKNYSFLYQLTHITHERGALQHDDRVEAVAGGVAHFTAALAIDSQEARQGIKAEEFDEMVEEFMESFEQGFPAVSRGKRRAGGRTEVTQVKI